MHHTSSESETESLYDLAERYPFNEVELEHILNCYNDICIDFGNEQNTNKTSSFLKKLSCHESTNTKDEMSYIESTLLPQKFGLNLLQMILNSSSHAIYETTKDNSLSIDIFLEGLAKCGRRGPKEASSMLFDICALCAFPSKKYSSQKDENENMNSLPNAFDLISLSYRLTIASSILDNTNKKESSKNKMELNPPQSLIQSLITFSNTYSTTHVSSKDDNNRNKIKKSIFIKWIDDMFPLLPLTLSTFIHNLLFHGQAYPPSRFPLLLPKLNVPMNKTIFYEDSNKIISNLLFPFACVSNIFGGKWHRLYSFDMDGQDFKQLEYSILGYNGPTILFIQAEGNQNERIHPNGGFFGAFTSSTWKQSTKFYGNGDSFLFQITPTFQLYHPTYQKSTSSNFMYLNPSHGLGFGGSNEKPRLFIPHSFDIGFASSFDTSYTYSMGNLLPDHYMHMEQFHVKSLEVWGVGGDNVIEAALKKQLEYRDLYNSNIHKARIIKDKSMFVHDMQTGLIESKMYLHRKQIDERGNLK